MRNGLQVEINSDLRVRKAKVSHSRVGFSFQNARIDAKSAWLVSNEPSGNRLSPENYAGKILFTFHSAILASVLWNETAGSA